MSRWTKGELTIGEIAQMERALIDTRRAGADVLTKLQQITPRHSDVAGLAAAVTQQLIATMQVCSVLELMLKG